MQLQCDRQKHIPYSVYFIYLNIPYAWIIEVRAFHSTRIVGGATPTVSREYKLELERSFSAGGNFHLKVGGPKAVAMLVTLCWGLQ